MRPPSAGWPDEAAVLLTAGALLACHYTVGYARRSPTRSDCQRLAVAVAVDTVSAARDAGHSWSAIAAALGVSRQAAHQRYSPSTRRAQP